MPLVSGGISSNRGRVSAAPGRSSASPADPAKRNCRRFIVLKKLFSMRRDSFIRIRLAGADNANLMIRELSMRPGKFDLRHMARHAVLPGHGTGLGMGHRRVAGAAFCIVRDGVGFQRTVRTVTGGTANAVVRSVVATAVRQPV